MSGYFENDENLKKYIPEDIVNNYEVKNYRNAAEILTAVAKIELDELLVAFSKFNFTTDDIRKPGGNESVIPKKISTLLRSQNWLETRITGDLKITMVQAPAIKKTKSRKKKAELVDPAGDAEESSVDIIEEIEKLKQEGAALLEKTLKNFLDGHKIDYVKNRVAFDLEWNSKDQTFDRDLYALRAFYECGLIDAAVLMTRSEDLNPVFAKMGAELDKSGNPKKKDNGKYKLIKEKYGASTTWMGKLLYRINAGRNGGCPILIFGITSKQITDLDSLDEQVGDENLTDTEVLEPENP